MLARSLFGLIVGLVCFACAIPAEANWFTEFCGGVIRDTKRRNCWPEPFVGPDRQSVRAPFAIMVAKGWERQNMLADHHFVDPSSGELSESGKLKVRWILQEAPRQHRIVYVHQSEHAAVTTARIDAVQQYITSINTQDELPPVVETNMPAGGWPASRVDMIGRKYEASIPAPRLPELQAGQGGGSN